MSLMRRGFYRIARVKSGTIEKNNSLCGKIAKYRYYGGNGYENGKKIAALLMVFTMVFSTLLPVHAQDIIPEASDIGQDIGTRWQGSIQNGTLCYVSDEGEKLTGLQEIDGQLYYFDDEGNAQTGWVEINGSLYYFALENGQAYRKHSSNDRWCGV